MLAPWNALHIPLGSYELSTIEPNIQISPMCRISLNNGHKKTRELKGVPKYESQYFVTYA